MPQTAWRAKSRYSWLIGCMSSSCETGLTGPQAWLLGEDLACDLRIASTSARLVTAFVRVGFSGDFGGSYFTRLVGTFRARELYFTGHPVGADEALSLGLVNRVVPDEELSTVTM